MVLVEEIHCLRRRLPRIKKAEVEEWDEPRAALEEWRAICICCGRRRC